MAGAHHSHHHPSPLNRLFTLIRPEVGDLWIIFLYAVVIGILNLAAPLSAMAVVNSVALATLVQQLIVMSLALLAALALSACFQALQTIVVEYLQRRVFVRVAHQLAFTLPRVDVCAFDRTHGPELMNRFFDVLTVQKAGATLLLDGVSITLQVVIGLVLLGFYDPVLLGFDAVLLTGLFFLFFVLGRGAVNSAIQESRTKYAVVSWLQDVARSPVTFKGQHGTDYVDQSTNKLLEKYLSDRSQHFRRLLRQISFGLCLQALASAGLLAVGGYLVINEHL
ncbi:MAG: peptidase domain-containing ABC transporter, partial [Gemmataceae bacterium]